MQQEKPRTIFFTDRLNDKDIGRWRTSGKDDGGAMMADFILTPAILFIRNKNDVKYSRILKGGRR
jgi:hypothetical protein